MIRLPPTSTLFPYPPLFRSSLEAALVGDQRQAPPAALALRQTGTHARGTVLTVVTVMNVARSEEHTSELQSRQYLVCCLLLEKKKEAFTSSHHYVQTSLLPL